MSRKKIICMHAGCREPAVANLRSLLSPGEDRWLCAQHTTIEVYRPENTVITMAGLDMQDFLDGDGKHATD
jgi:hypothetical protein